MINTKKLFTGVAVAIAFLVLAVIFGVYDLDISMAIASTSSKFGLVMENAGMLVAPYLCMMAGIILATYCQKAIDMRLRKTKIAVCILITFAAVCFVASIYVKFTYFMSFFAFLITGIALGLFIYLMRGLSSEKLYSLMKMAIITIIYFIAVLVVIDVIKLFWGRVRFRDMTDFSAQFSHFYIPQGINGNYSFPSGHTANAATLYVVIMLSGFCMKKWQKALCYIIPIVWVIVMAYSRVLVGAHFASDVLFGGGISIGLFYLTRYVVCKKLD